MSEGEYIGLLYYFTKEADDYFQIAEQVAAMYLGYIDTCGII